MVSTLYEIRNLDQHNPNRPHELLILNGPRGVGKLYAACETICQVLPYRSLDVIRPRESSQSDQDLSSDLFGTTGAITSILSQTQSTPQERVIVIDAGERMKLRCIDDLTAQLNAIRLAPDQFHSSLTSHCLFVLIVAADPTVGLTREMRDKKLFEATSWPAQFVARSREVIEFGRMSNEERGIAVAAMIESSFANHGVRVDSIAPQAIIDGVKI